MIKSYYKKLTDRLDLLCVALCYRPTTAVYPLPGSLFSDISYWVSSSYIIGICTAISKDDSIYILAAISVI